MMPRDFSERVLPGTGFYVMSLLLPMGVWLVFVPISQLAGLALAIFGYLALVAAAFLRSPKIEIHQGNLRLNNAVVPIAKLGEANTVNPEDVFFERGLKLDSRAYTRFQVGVRPLVKIKIKDELDSTPYWLFSCRKTAALLSALDANRP